MFRWRCWPAGAAILLNLPVAAQTFGEITGVITDQSGGEVVGVSMTANNPQPDFTRQQ